MKNVITFENLGTVNKNFVRIGELGLWFSYSTIVAFTHTSTGFNCSVNEWSTTTGKLLNEICPDHKARLNRDIFIQKLDNLLDKLRYQDRWCENCSLSRLQV
ncbi:hypothetical protein LCGC14_3116310 [marine sediment metagenome]|uniref:DUF8033 domain-containing protein n=1 Tax=marine sediment metagenome TaxID=412755 RepID=A0A0F8W3K4_9ZZZZ